MDNREGEGFVKDSRSDSNPGLWVHGAAPQPTNPWHSWSLLLLSCCVRAAACPVGNCVCFVVVVEQLFGMIR